MLNVARYVTDPDRELCSKQADDGMEFASGHLVWRMSYTTRVNVRDAYADRASTRLDRATGLTKICLVPLYAIMR